MTWSSLRCTSRRASPRKIFLWGALGPVAPQLVAPYSFYKHDFVGVLLVCAPRELLRDMFGSCGRWPVLASDMCRQASIISMNNSRCLTACNSKAESAAIECGAAPVSGCSAHSRTAGQHGRRIKQRRRNPKTKQRFLERLILDPPLSSKADCIFPLFM